MKKRLLALALVVSLCATALPVHAAQFGLSGDRAEIPVTDSSCLPSAEDNVTPVASEQDVSDQPAASAPLPSEDSAAPVPQERDVSAQLSASDPLDSGSCLPGTTNTTNWALYEGGLLQISGTGIMPRYGGSNDGIPWYKYRDQITAVQVEDGVTTVGHYSFANCPQLTTVTLADSVTSLGNSAFLNCSALTTVTLGSGVTTLSTNCFSNCSALTDFTLPDSITTVSTGAFQGCSQLKAVTVGSGLSSCGKNAFDGCTALERVYVTDLDTSWYSILFADANANPLTLAHNLYVGGKPMTTLTIPDSVTTIKQYAFSGWTGLTTLTMGSGSTLTSVEPGAFNGCAGLNDVFYPGADHSAIAINGSGNTALLDAFWHHNFNGGSLVTLTTAPAEHGTLRMPRYAFPGEMVTVTPIPEPGYQLDTVSVDTGALDAELHYTVPQDETLETVTFTATFEPLYPGRPIAASGSCGGSLNWIMYEDGLFLLSGYGQMEPYTSAASAPWHKYRSQITSVVIDNGVLSVGGYAFSDCPYLTSVTIPASITDIGNNAFANCANLGRAEFMGAAPRLGDKVFFKNIKNKLQLPTPGQFCVYYHEGKGWDSLITPPEVQNGPNTWNDYCVDCVDAEPITDFSTLDEGCRNSQGILFTLNRDSLSARVGNNSDTEINNSGYYGSNNGVVTIPATVTADGMKYRVDNVSQMSFASNKTVREVILGENVESMHPSSFQDASNLARITPDKANKAYRDIDGVLYYLFDNEPTTLFLYPPKKKGASFTVPETVKTVITNAFRSNLFLEEVTVPSNVTDIGPEVFYNCHSLSKLTLPFLGNSREDSLPFPRLFSTANSPTAVPRTLKEVIVTDEELCEKAFQGCSNIQRITLPSCHTIPASSFQSCSSLVSLRFADSDLPYADSVLLLPGTVADIGTYAFANCTNLTSTIFAEGLTTLGGHAFRGCTALTSVTMPEGLQTIGASTFSGCGALMTATIPGTVTSIGASAFSQCGSLPDIVIPDSVQTIGDQAFAYCTSAQRVTIGRGLNKLGGKRVFDMCYKVQAFEVDKANASFASDRWGVLFNKNMSTLLNYPASRSLPKYLVPRATKTISSYAFQRHSGLQILYLSENVTDCEKDAFDPSAGTDYYAHQPGTAYSHLISNGFSVHSATPASVVVKGLPDCAALPLGSDKLEGPLEGVYLVANYSGQAYLDVEEYDVSFGPIEPSGYQEVTLSFEGESATFEVLRYDPAQYSPLYFGPLDQDLKDATRFAALYKDGKMLSAYTPLVINGKLLVRADKDHAATMDKDKAALFQLDAKTFAPVAAPTPLPTTP